MVEKVYPTLLIEVEAVFRGCYKSYSDMDIEAYKKHCFSKKEVTAASPFGEKTLVYNVIGDTLTLAAINTFARINLQYDPETAIQLRELYAGVAPGYHMNKKHWNTIRIDRRIPDKRASMHGSMVPYRLVVGRLPNVARERLEPEG